MTFNFWTFGLLGGLILWTDLSHAGTMDEAITPCMERDLARAETYITSFKNDSAVAILRPIMAELERHDQLDSPFGIRVQLAEATALEADRQEEKALRQLLRVKELSRQKECWETHAKTCLVLALLYEKFDRDALCRENLEQARTTIQTRDLPNLYPQFAVRTASYFRVFQISRDSAMFYAKEALRTAPRYNLRLEEAISHLLMGMLWSGFSYGQAVEHFAVSGKLYRELEDYALHSATLFHLSRLHLNNGQFRLALAYNDSTIAVSHRAIAAGTERHSVLHRALQLRADIYRNLGQFDSTWHYLRKGQALELDQMRMDNQDKVMEIEAHYRDEKKEQQLAEQTRQLQFERDKRNVFLTGAIVAFLFAFIIAGLHVRLRAANRKTRKQAQALRQANEELSASLQKQMMLQGEIHHRVKNNLQVIISMLELQKEDIADPAARRSFETMSGRIHSMAAIHELLYQQEGTKMVNLLDYARRLCQHFSDLSAPGFEPRFSIDIASRSFTLETLMPLGIILNEMLTNSLKYAAGASGRLAVGIRLSPYGDGYCLQYRDNGPGFPQGELQEREGGLGTYLLRSMCRQLNGRLESRNEGGAVFSIFFKEKNIAA